MAHPCSCILCLFIILPEQDLVRIDEFVFSLLFKCIIYIRGCLHLIFSFIFNNVKIDEAIWVLDLRRSKCLSVWFLIMFLLLLVKFVISYKVVIFLNSTFTVSFLFCFKYKENLPADGD